MACPAVNLNRSIKGILLSDAGGPPKAKRQRLSRRSTSWAAGFDYVEFNSKRSPAHTIKQCMQNLDMVDESQDDDPGYDEAQLIAGNFDEWETIVLPPQAHPMHTGKANDRSLAYARRRALDLERAPGVNDMLFDPAVVIFWDGGLAEKVEYGFTDYTSKKGLPRPPKIRDV